MRMITGTGGFAIARSWVAVGASIGMLAAVTLSSATVAGAADTETIVGNTSSILVSADTTLQSWKNEKNQDNAAKSYIGALQPQGYGEFGEAFESTDTNDGTDAKMGLLSFDLSRYDSTPVSATLRLSYLGYAGRTSTDEQRTDSIVITAVDDTQCANDADSCAPNTATWRTRPRFDATDGRQVARSNEFIVGLTKYGDNMTVSSATTVDVDVTDIVKNQMEQGRKSLTLAMGGKQTYRRSVRKLRRCVQPFRCRSFNGTSVDCARSGEALLLGNWCPDEDKISSRGVVPISGLDCYSCQHQ